MAFRVVETSKLHGVGSHMTFRVVETSKLQGVGVEPAI